MSFLNIFFFLFSGFAVKTEDLSWFWIWAVCLSPLYYGLCTYTLILFDNVNILMPSTVDRPEQQLISGDAFLYALFGVKRDRFYTNIWALAIVTVGVRLVAMACMEVIGRKRKKENE
eukprot:GHVS01027708.1.p1 GENE.GHVS01027708.1~~GHVS01027708.1.p1  ORF type:complete len:117 (-),score=15.34 GHVS01027708.1:100-450(-)